MNKVNGIADTFLNHGGDMARRIALHDWAATPIGAVEGWPTSLMHTVAFLLHSPVPLVLLWGDAGVMIYNDAYSCFAGSRDDRLLGSNVREGWDEIADFNDNVMRVGLAGGTLSYRDLELTLHRDGNPEQVWMNLDYSPVMGDDGNPAGVLAIVVETTEAHHARKALQESAERLRFLDELGSAVAGSRSARDILAITTRLTAQHIGISLCMYADMDDDGDGFTIRGDWHGPGSPSVRGHYSLETFGALAVEKLNAGSTFIINDAQAELGADDAASFQAMGIAATVCMPLVKGGRLVALMAISDKTPRRWTDYELGLIREVTERSWAHVQRVGAEGALREREAYHRQIIDGAIDYGIIATDLDGTITLWNRGAAEIVGWSEAEVVGKPMALLFTPEDRETNRPAAKRAEALAAGRASDARWHLRTSGERFWGLSEMAPLHGADGQPIGFVKLMRDRTQEHEAQAALAESEGRLRRAQAAGGVGVFTIDLAQDVLFATEEFCRIFGIAHEAQIASATIEQMVIPEDQDVVSHHAGRSTGTVGLSAEYRIRRASDGEERIISRKAEFERDASGKPVRMIGVVQDVTDRRRIELALQKSEAQFKGLAQNMPNHVWTARPDGHLDWLNDRVYAYSGYAPGSLDGAGWTQLVHRDDAERTQRVWAQAVATGQIYETEFRLRDSLGHYRWHLARAVPLVDADGSITAWVGTSTEIEAQKQAEAAYAQDRDRLWTISRDLMMVCDYDGIITAVNPSGERLLGWQESDMLGQHVTNFVHPDDLPSTADELSQLTQGAPTLIFENRYRTTKGDYRLLAWAAVPDGGRIHAVGRDITEVRAVEDALRQSQKMEAVGQLTGGIAHDFNNLLQGITGSLDIMHNRLTQNRPQDLQRWLTGAKTSAERAAALTHRLLAFSRRQPLDPKSVHANPLVASMEDMLRRTLGEQIELELALATGPWITKCDPNQLESAILNLAINARDAMPQGGKLTVGTRNARFDESDAALHRIAKPGDYLCIYVSDTGMGMSAQTAARAFEPFFTTKPIGQGTGLGLSMIYGFARQSEGHAQIESASGNGTTVKLFLPRYHGIEQSDAALREDKALPGSRPGEVVLVVEDEPVVRSLIVEVLADLGYQTIEAQDGPGGLAVLQSTTRIDLLVTDIGLPGMNGRQVADAARLHRPDLKVLFMTGYAENAALASGFLEQGMAMITKPFAIDALATRIRQIIEE